MDSEHPIGTTLENRLMSQGVYVTRFESTNDRTILEYEMVHDEPGVTTHEVSVVVRTVLTLAEERPEWDPGRLEVTAFSTAETRRGTWYVEESWFDGLDEEIDELEFSQHVLDSIQHDQVGK